ncbi:hypothetical protein WA158_007886 [Blastocystis sp. Blastoise]
MCGICLSLLDLGEQNKETAKEIVHQEIDAVKEEITLRGPDSQNEVELSDTNMCFFSSVLHIRGENTVSQPLVDENGNMLLWNGEVYDGLHMNENENDTEKVSQLLASSTTICEDMENIKGEYSFVYYNKTENILYFGRDKCGRRSLLMKIKEYIIDNNTYYGLTLSSVGTILPDSTSLIPAVILSPSILDMSILDPTPVPYSLNYINTWIEIPPLGIYTINLNEYHQQMFHIQLLPWKSTYIRNKLSDYTNIPDSFLFPDFPPNLVDSAHQLQHALENSISKRLFYTSTKEKGISILFSGGIDCSLITAITSTLLPRDYFIELLNISFDNPFYNSPDRRTALNSYIDLMAADPSREYRFICVDVSIPELIEEEQHILQLIHPKTSTMDFHIGAAFHFASRGNGKIIEKGNHTIDEMKELVGYKIELNNEDNAETIPEPGYIHILKDYKATCKLILSGTGADELYGGYTRHYALYNKEGWKALENTLEMEYNRLWIRNLGYIHDDRCISSNGKEIRFPFLDEDIVQLTYSLPIYHLIDPRLPKGQGDKLILRVLCKIYGLYSCIHLSKRAIQFGSRIVKQLNIVDGKNSKQTKGHLKYHIHS